MAICDCERGHNGLGIVGRECDCRPSPQELAGFALRMVVERIAFRIDAMNERGLDGVSISKGFATEIVSSCRRGAGLLENPEPAQAGARSRRQKDRGPRK